MKKLLLFAFAIVISFTHSLGQLKLPALSPTCKVVQEFSTSSIELSYSRPSMRNRKVFGDLVPYNVLWRTGANAATKLKFGEDVEINGLKLKAGEYALYTIPGKESWEVVINTGITNWGTDGYSREHDVLRFKLKPTRTDEICQTFTLNFVNITYSTCQLELRWEKTRLLIPIAVKNEDAIETNIDKTINHPTLPYYQVANYYYETNKHLDRASQYVEAGITANPKAYYMWNLKARIEKKMGHYDKAIIAAQKAIETSKEEDTDGEYRKMNEKLIDDIRKTNKLNPTKNSY
ncbi:MAG: DUF2911 domain-containing protein [Chitinophagia bacterium]|nr:DUF2911 domain-containing protein [Chitinophagia bacterium]